MKLTRILLILAALSLPVFGQTTTYTGTIRDLSNAVVTSGNVTFTLTPSIDTTISGISRFVPSTVTCGISGTGTVLALDLVSPCTVTQNTALTPTGTSYKVCLQPYFTSPGSCFIDYAVTSSKDITTVAPTPALSPSYNYITQSALATASVLHATTATTATTAASATKVATQDKGFVNAVSDSSAPIDGTTDAASALTACLTSASGKSCKLPKQRTAISGGVTGSYCDYTIASRVVFPDANGTILEGVAPSTWSGAVRVCVSSGVGGFRIGKLCYSCGMKNIEVVNTNTWDYTDSTTWFDWTGTSLFSGDGADGIQLLGGSPLLENVTVVGFARHGVYIDGAGTIQASSQPDLWHLKDVQVYNNKAYGLYIAGGDSNAGLAELVRARYNNLGGVYNASILGNTFISLFTDGNTRNAITAGANKTIAAANGLVVASNVLTINTTTSHGWPIGSWVTTTGSTDGTFNGTCKLLTASGTTATCNFTHADGNTANGTAATSSSTQIYAYYTAKGITFGPVVTSSGSVRNVFINPYSEATVQQPYQFGSSTMVIDGNHAATDISWTNNPVWLTHNSGAFKAYGTAPFAILNPTDNAAGLDISSGSTLETARLIRFMDKANTTVQWAMGQQSSNAYWYLREGAAGNFFILANKGGALDFNPVGNTTFYGTNAIISTAGLGTFAGGVKAGASGSTISDSRELVQNARSCGTTTTCANTANGSNRIVFGSATMAAGTVTVTGITAFTSTSSYFCSGSNQTTAAAFKIANTSTTSITITGTGTDVIAYQCIGN